MQQQDIPIGTLVATGAYRDFLKMRREALAQRMNAFIEEKSGT